MAAPTVRSSTTASAIQGGFSISKPTGTVQNDLLLFCMVGKNNTNFDQPSGFTKIGSTLIQGGTRLLLVAYKVAGASEGSSYTPNVSLGDSSDFYISTSAVLICITGINTSSPIDVTATGQSTSTVPTLTTSGADRLVISVVGASDAPSTLATVPSTWTSIANVVTSTNGEEEDARTQTAYKTYASAGSIGTNTWSASRNNLFTIAIAPAATVASYNSGFLLQGN